MNLIQKEHIELNSEEVHALDIIRRLGEHISGSAKDEEHRAKGNALYQACAALEFVHNIVPEDPEEVILRRKNLGEIKEGDWSIDDLKSHLPVVCARLIDYAIEDACDTAREEGFDDGYNEGYSEGYEEGSHEWSNP